MRIKNKSTIYTAYLSLLGNLKIPPVTTVNVPVQYSEELTRDAIKPFPHLTLLDGYFVSQDDIENAEQTGQGGVMVKDVYDTDYNNIVDSAEHLVSTKTSLEVEFNYNDFASLSKNIGLIASGLNIEEIRVVVETAFDSGFVVVGDDTVNDRLMDSSSSDIKFLGTYVNYSNYVYPSNTLVKLFMNGSPTVGSGKIVLFVS